MSGQLIYLRAKRLKTTVFVECRTKDSIASVKATLAEIVGQDAELIRLLGSDSKPLVERSTLEEAQLKNESIIFFVFSNNGKDWEEVFIPQPEATLVQEDEDDEE